MASPPSEITNGTGTAPIDPVASNRPISPSAVPGADPPNQQQQAPVGQNQQLGQAVVEIKTISELQITHLVDMQIEEAVDPDVRKKLVAQEALREWKEAQSGLEAKVERRTKQADKLIFEIYQLVGLYSVFVGVVFTAAVQSENLRCQHVWSPVLLCAFAWLLIILITRKRWKAYTALRATIKTEGASRAVLYGRISALKSYGHKNFDFNKDAVEAELGKPKTPSTICGVRVRVLSSWVIPLVLTALTLILVGSFIHILCY